MILTSYIDLKHKWEISTCWENSPLKELAKNIGVKNLTSFDIHKKIVINYYNRMISILIKNMENEIKESKEKVNKIKKSKDKKELQKIVSVFSCLIESMDFNDTKHFLIYWYQTKIKHYEEELNTSSYCRGKSQIL